MYALLTRHPLNDNNDIIHIRNLSIFINIYMIV